MKIALVGAGGFVGARAMEYFTLTGKAEVRGIVRRYASLARLSRFEADWRIADATQEDQLADAFFGCDIVLHSIMGDNSALAGCAEPTYRAAERAGVSRIVLISTAAVHGLRPDPASDETTRLSPSGLGDYAAAKLQSESDFLRLATSSKVELAVLRPSIIVGPRSTWISQPAEQLLAGCAPLAEGGPGICNSVYVDNLIEAALLAAQSPHARNQIFLVADDAPVTWAEYYRRLADSLHLPASAIQMVAEAASPPVPKKPRSANAWLQIPAFKAAALLTPAFAKNILRRPLGIRPPPPQPLRWPCPAASLAVPALSREVAALHVSPWQISSAKARRVLGYRPEISVADGLQRSVEWLRYAGLAGT